MKTSIILTGFMLLYFGLFSQTIVSTAPANKNVLLEEYTGINCQFCPDGHRIANQIMEANPNRVFGINIHQGSYATPGSGQPDFRTAFGDALAGQTALTGYPCGTISRHAFTSPAPMTSGGTAQSRSNWVNCTNQILAQASPVNVAIDASLNEATRELSILVEVYYTSNGSPSTNSLNIAVLQDYVLGPQVGSSYNPDYIFGTQYYHMHMLRTLLFGQWGVTIPTTTAGTFYDTAFVYTIPASYGAITAELYNLKLIAFVSQGHQEVLTADEYKILAPLDAGVSDIINVPAVMCSGSFTPSVTLTNNGSTTITTADINYYIDSETPTTQVWNGSLASGASTVVVLPSITPSTGGAHVFNVAVSDPNGSTDYLSLNDATKTSFVAFLTNITAPVQQAFASATFPPTDWASLDATGDGKNWARGSAGHSAAGSAFINFYNIGSGSYDDMILSPADFSTMTNASMTFYVAYRQYGTENDKLQVDVSTNCGSTWTTEWTKQGTALTTGVDVTSNWTSPTASEWRQELVDLSDYDGMSDVMIRFRSTSAYGNNLFFDDVNIDEALSIEQTSENASISVYPNPANDQAFVEINAINGGEASVAVYDATGRLVVSELSSINGGMNLITLNTSELNAGVYSVSVTIGEQITTIRLMITK